MDNSSKKVIFVAITVLTLYSIAVVIVTESASVALIAFLWVAGIAAVFGIIVLLAQWLFPNE